MSSAVEAWTGERTGLQAELDASTLRSWQMARVREMLRYARTHSAFYRTQLASIDIPSIQGFEHLAQLPFTEPADLARDPGAFLCVAPRDVARVVTLSTSGSTGEKKRIFFTERDLDRTVDFFTCGMGMLTRSGQTTLILLGGDTENGVGRLLQTAIGRIGGEGRLGRPEWSAEERLAAARTAQCIVGMAGDLIHLCRMDGSLRPESVLLSADYVPTSVVTALREQWRCRVFTHFGMTETGFGCAVQCASGEGHHLRDPDLLVEIIDPDTGRQLPPGRRGELVITLLRSEAMPLIRYRTGDLASLLHGPCSCGGSLPRLGRVEGRRANAIALAEGRTVSIHDLDDLLFAIPAVRSFEAELAQVKGRFTLFLTVDATQALDPEALAARLPADVALQVAYAPRTSFSHRGKRSLRLRSHP